MVRRAGARHALGARHTDALLRATNSEHLQRAKHRLSNSDNIHRHYTTYWTRCTWFIAATLRVLKTRGRTYGDTRAQPALRAHTVKGTRRGISLISCGTSGLPAPASPPTAHFTATAAGVAYLLLQHHALSYLSAYHPLALPYAFYVV